MDSFTFIFAGVNYQQGYPIYNPVVYVGMTGELAYQEYPIGIRTLVLDHPVCGYLEGSRYDVVMDFSCPPQVTGRYVFVDSYSGGNHNLHSDEVEVYGEC